MKKIYSSHFFILLTISFLFLSGCEKFRCIEGNGIARSEIRETPAFNGVISRGDYDVEIIEDTIFEVYVETDENIQPYISTEVRGGRLILENETDRCLDTEFPVFIQIRTPDIHAISLEGSGYMYCPGVFNNILNIDLSGSGKIEVDNIDTREITATLSGSGEIELWGVANYSRMDIPGSGTIKAFGLYHDECVADISGSGDIYVFVYDILDVLISGSGNVFFKGNPSIYTDITGSGNIFNSN